jgi:CPA2 family monovalent cation:H+ antiporter-2
MPESHLLGQIAILFGTAVAVSWLFRVARAPSILGFLFTGMLIGPSAFGWIGVDSVRQFAEIGLVLLLFTVGLELSPAPLLQTGRELLKATGLQMASTGVVATAVAWFALDLGPLPSVLVGLGVSLSSTAIALKQLSDRGEVSSVMGNLITGILLLQDVAVIVVMVLLPLVSDVESEHGRGPWFMLGAFAALVAIVVGGRKALPAIINQIVGRGGQELTTLFAVMMAGGGAWLASLAGWSPALGACVAGLLLANADIRHQLVADIVPFRDVFNALFFISVGMLVDIDAALEQAGVILLAVAATLLLKGVLTAVAVSISGWPQRLSWRVGLGMCTVSEFAYVLLHQAENAGLVTQEFVQVFVAYLVGTMMLGALVFPVGLEGIERLARRARGDGAEAPDEETGGEGHLHDHVIVVGYGVTGSNLARVLHSTHVPFCVVEMNQSLAREAQSVGAAEVVLGDAARVGILRHAGVRRANVLVVSINDPQATRRIVSIARAASSTLHIVVRTQYVRELENLSGLGANVVVPADFEASVRIFSHVLEELGVPRNILAAQIAAVRAGGYGVFRGKSSSSQESLEDLLKVLQISATQTFFLPETSPACGQTLRELDLRNRTGATLIAVVRDRNPITNPEAGFRLAPNDVLVLVGAHAQLNAAQQLLSASSQLDATPPAPEL